MHELVYPRGLNGGQHATALLAGRSRAGLPIGLERSAGYLEDRTLIVFAALVQHRHLGKCPVDIQSKDAHCRLLCRSV
jgi:hypothetical protein